MRAGIRADREASALVLGMIRWGTRSPEAWVSAFEGWVQRARAEGFRGSPAAAALKAIRGGRNERGETVDLANLAAWIEPYAPAPAPVAGAAPKPAKKLRGLLDLPTKAG